MSSHCRFDKTYSNSTWTPDAVADSVDSPARTVGASAVANTTLVTA